GLELEHPQLGSALVPEHLGLDLHLREVVAVEDLLVTAVEQRLERELVALARGQALDEQGLPLLDAVLLTAGLDDCVGHDHSEAPEALPSPAVPALARERR